MTFTSEVSDLDLFAAIAAGLEVTKEGLGWGAVPVTVIFGDSLLAALNPAAALVGAFYVGYTAGKVAVNAFPVLGTAAGDALYDLFH